MLVRSQLADVNCALFQLLPLHICRGVLHIRAEVVCHTRDIFVTTFSANKLKSSSCCFGRIRPFFVIHRIMEDQTWVKVWQNNFVSTSNSNALWPVSRIPLTALCNGDIDRSIKIEIWGHQNSGRHQYIGCVETTARGLMDSMGAPFDLIDQDKKATKRNYVNSGAFFANNVLIEQNPSMSEVYCVNIYINMLHQAI